jgi:outer membrane protein OmpA-like peptidoglycan-associated protein/protocatechuate 3,4-dioxygenase beta subunit
MWFVGLAWAQQFDPLAGDLHGPNLPIPDGRSSTPVFVQTPAEGGAGSLQVGLTAEGFRGTAFVEYLNGDREAVLSGGLLTGLSARGGVTDWLDLAAALSVAPVVALPSPFTPEPPRFGRGDVQLAAPIQLARRVDGAGASFGLIPELTVPTGGASALVGERGPTAGLRVAAGRTFDRWQLAADVGARAQPSLVVAGLERGPARLSGAAALGVRPAGAWWLRAEARGWSSVGGSLADGGVEVLGSSGLVAGPVRWSVGAGRGVVGGLGASSLRVVTALSFARVPDRARPPTEVPDGLPGYLLRVAGPDGRPVIGAEVVVAGTVAGVTGLDGTLQLAEEPRWSQVIVRAPGFLEGTPPKPEGEAALSVALAYAPSPVRVSITDPEGRPVAATALARSETGQEIALRDGDALPPGRYALEITAPGFGPQQRVIDVFPRAPVDPVEAVLLPDTGGRASMSITLLDPDGQPVDGARVLIDGIPVGTTDQGVLTIGALVAGPHSVEVLHDGFTGVVASSLDLTDGAELALPLTLQRQPGTVRVRVRAPDGRPVDDAVVRFIGPRRLAPMSLGVQGERTDVLGPGTWAVTVTSPRYGLQEREIVVPPDRYDLLTVDFVLQPDEAGGGELLVRVIDPDGRPVEGVGVTIDDRDYGATASGGTLAVSGLVPGVRAVAIDRPGLRDEPPRDVTVSTGIQETLFSVAWDAGAVDVTVRETDGPAEGARVRFADATGEGSASDVGPDGHVFTTLAPGTWTIAVTSPTAGLQERDLTILPDSRTLHRAEFVLAPHEDGLSSLALRVVGPTERPIDGAKVSLDGEPRGTTSNLGTLRLSDLDVGTRSLVVWTEPYEPEVRDVRLLEGEQELEVSLDWAVGATRVHVERDGAPLPDAVVRFLGEHPHPPMPVDGAGDALARLEPGFWLVVATSPTGGVAEWDLEVKDQRALHQVDLDMSGNTEGRVDLFVRVVDPYGRPVEHATVWLDGGQKAGETEQGGAVLARDLAPGVVSLRVEAPDFLPTEPVEVELSGGTVERVVRIRWPEVPVVLRAVDESDEPIEAFVQWVGPRDVPELRTDGEGSAEATLAPGAWRAIARAADGRALAGEIALAFELGDEPRPKTIVLRPTRAVMAGGAVVLDDTVPFDFGKATLRPEAAPIVEELARLLIAQPDIVRLEVQGHTDNVGGVPFNQALSQARADAVRDALVARGVALEKLVATGYGPTRPLAPNDTDDGRARNRRVQFVVVERAAAVQPSLPRP